MNLNANMLCLILKNSKNAPWGALMLPGEHLGVLSLTTVTYHRIIYLHTCVNNHMIKTHHLYFLGVHNLRGYGFSPIKIRAGGLRG